MWADLPGAGRNSGPAPRRGNGRAGRRCVRHCTVTPRLGLAILREPQLREADLAGLLPAAAAAGAQVRSVLTAVHELSPLERPRAMVIIGDSADIDVAF